MEKYNKGITLIELILVISLISIITLLGFNIFKFGFKAQKMTDKEYQIQSEMRVASTKINNYIRYSTAIFTIEDFGEFSVTNGWNYLMVSEDGREIVEYIYNPENESYKKNILVAAQENIKYKLEFMKENPYYIDKLLKFTLNGYYINEDGSEEVITIQSEVEALNSLQVIDKGNKNQISTILAYRDDKRPLAAEAAITMVLDTSGSMDRNMYNKEANNLDEKRINILRREANKLIENFSQMQNIYLSLVPFSTSANNPGDFLNVYENKLELQKFINSAALNPGGGTNTGDGMRRAYYKIKDFNNDSNKRNVDINNYMIILVDGVTTFASVTKPSENHDVKKCKQIFSDRYKYFNGKKYFFKDSWFTTSYYYRFEDYIKDNRDIEWGTEEVNVWSGNLWGFGNEIDEDGEEYVEKIGEIIEKYPQKIKVYVIGFSAITSDLESLNNIANATGALKVFKAGNDEELESIFEEIKEDIFRDLWHISGPR